MNKVAILLLATVMLNGCATTIANHRLGGVYSTSCGGYEQSTSNIEATLKLAEELHAEGKMTKTELITVDQESGLYSQKLSNLCSFFRAGDITFEQYQDGVEKADQKYREIRALVLGKKG